MRSKGVTNIEKVEEGLIDHSWNLKGRAGHRGFRVLFYPISFSLLLQYPFYFRRRESAPGADYLVLRVTAK